MTIVSIYKNKGNKMFTTFTKKTILLMSVSLITSAALYGGSHESTFKINQSASAIEYAEGEVLVRFKQNREVNSVTSTTTVTTTMNSSTTITTMNSLLGTNTYEEKRFNKFSSMFVTSKNHSTEELIEELSKMSSVESVSRNYKRHLLGKTNDSDYSTLWGLDNEGQDGGTSDADIDAKEAWDLQTGSKSVVVAVVDTGIDYNHPDLVNNMWDGTPYNIPHHGWDFASDSQGNDDNDPLPSHEHGSHVAGTIGASANNSLGIVGVSHNVSLMALQVFRPDGSGYDSDILQAMEFILDRIKEGVNVVAINASYGGGGSSDVMKNAIEELGKQGVVFCAAAGNEGQNNDSYESYPANYDLSNIISIAATDRNDQLADFSNYGENSVDIAAPGVDIRSTTPNNSYATWSGTSMATPHVVGAIALLAANNPKSSVTTRINTLLSNVDVIPSLTGKVSTGGRLNINKALIADNGNENVNEKPTANAGDNQTANREETITLNGSDSSDKNGDSLTYKWEFVSKPTGSTSSLSNSNTTSPTFVADVAGEYVLQLIVNDGKVNSDPSNVTITVSGSSDGGADVTTWTTGAYNNNEDRSQKLSISGASSLVVRVVGKVESSFDFIYIYDASGKEIAQYDGTINKTLIVQGSSITARLLSDSSETASGVTVSISEEGEEVNNKPIANAGTNQNGHTGDSILLNGSKSSDKDEDSLTYQWKFNSKPSGSKALFTDKMTDSPSFIADKVGNYVVELIVNDGTVDSSPSTITVTVVDKDDIGDTDVTTWTTGRYENDEDISKELFISGASSLIVTVKGKTEEYFDYIYIYDENDKRVAKLDGRINKKITVQGSSIRARLVSDSFVNKSGVTVTIE
jgi:subtilisin family serine protease